MENFANAATQRVHTFVEYISQIKKKDVIETLFSGVWGLTGGAICALALNTKVNLLTSLTSLAAPLVDVVILSATDNKYSCQKVNNCSLPTISYVGKVFTAFFTFGATSLMILNHVETSLSLPKYSDDLQTKIFVAQGLLTVTHILTGMVFKKWQSINSSENNSILTDAHEPNNLIVSKSDNSDFKPTDLLPKIKELKQINEQWEERFFQLESFMNENQVLIQAFNAGIVETKKILLKPYIPGKAESPNPIIAEWETESHKKLEFEAKSTRLSDFMNKNPKFKTLFLEELGKIGQKTILDKM